MADDVPVAPTPMFVVTLPAEIDRLNADEVRELLDAKVSPGAVVIADMTATGFCDSSGARALLLSWQRATDCGGELRLVLPAPDILRVLGVLGVDRVLPIFPSLKEALAAGPSDPPRET